MNEQTTLAGRTILVTGATGALGTEVSKACAAAGAQVIILGRSIPRLEKLYDAITALGGPDPAIYPLDLAGASEQDYRTLATTLRETFGGLQGLVHCAAEFGHLAPLVDVTAEQWQRSLHVNLTAPFVLTRELTPFMIESGPGRVLFVGDSAVGDGHAWWGAYGVAKLALGGYATILNQETTAFGLHASLFVPGPMRSPVRLRAYPAEDRQTLPSPATPAAAMVRLLCSTHDSDKI